jgi:hypothetical protein
LSSAIVPLRLARSRPAGINLGRFGEIMFFVAAVGANWACAASIQSQLFSWTSFALLGWLLIVIGRLSPVALILLLPLAITRVATLVSLIAIEAGAYMPEVNRLGSAGDASASFVAFTALFFLVAAFTIRIAEPLALRHARSPLLDRLVVMLGWPVLMLCAAWGALSAIEGLRHGFPLIEGVDRFLYRRAYSGPFTFTLLDNKFLVAALIGAIAFRPAVAQLLKAAAILLFVLLTALFFLFGDKFFTILTSVAFFTTPLLLRRHDDLVRTLLRAAPLALALICTSLGATLYIYSGYGRLPLDRTATLVGERIAGQGELWFVASRDRGQATNWDDALVGRYVAALREDEAPAAALANGIETFYFIQHYSPQKLLVGFRRSKGFVQLTAGTEAMALVMFGYLGVAVVMMLSGLLVGFGLLYLLRALASGFPLSIFFSVWTFLQIYIFVQQASFWSIAAPGQIKRLLLFLTIELGLFAFNRAQSMARRSRQRAADFHGSAAA